MTEIREALFEVGCRAERNVRVLNLSHCLYPSLLVQLPLYLYRATFGCPLCVIAWGSESSVPSPGKETSQIFTLFVELSLPFQIVSVWMLRTISHQNREPIRYPRHVQAYRPRSFVDDLPFVFFQFLNVSREDCLLLVWAIVQI